MKKRGISGIVTTVLIILIAVSLISIISIFLFPLINEKLAAGNYCSVAISKVYIDSNSGYSCVDLNNHILPIQIVKEAEQTNLVGAKVRIMSEGNSIQYDVKLDPSKTKETFYLDIRQIEKLDNVMIAPLIRLNGNKIVECGVSSSIIPPDCELDLSLVQKLISEDKIIKKEYANNQRYYPLNVNIIGEGTYEINTPFDLMEAGDLIEIRAVPTEGWGFANFGTIDQLDYSIEGDLIRFILPNKELTINMYFQELKPEYKQNLVGYWNFNQNSEDYSGNRNNARESLTIYDSIGGLNSGAYRFENNQSYLEIDNPLLGEEQVTICAWYLQEEGWRYSAIYTDYTIIQKNIIFGYFPSESQTRIYFFAGKESTGAQVSIYPAERNKWTHTCGVFDGKNNKLMISLNDNFVESEVITFDRIGSIQTEKSTIGRFGNNYFTGKIDDLAMWNRALTQQEILELYNEGNGPVLFQ